MKEAVNTYHPHNLGVYIIRDDFTLGSNVLEQFGKGLCFHLFALKFGICVVEIEQDCTLVQLLDEEPRTLGRWRLYTRCI